jgi:MSHA biogenesis protein MshI
LHTAPFWTAVDAGLSGELLMVSVQGSGPRGRPPRIHQATRVDSAGWTAAALRELVGKRKRRGKTVAVLPRGDYQLMLLPQPPVPKAELDRSVRWAVASQVDFPVEEAVIATLELPEQAAPSLLSTPALGAPAQEDRSIYVVCAQNSVVQAVAACFKEAGHGLDAVDVRETAQRNVAALLEDGDECLCLLRVTTIGVQLTFTRHGELYLDRFIAQPLDALQAATDFERERIVERIAQQTLLSVGHIRSRHPHMDVRRVVLCPLPVPLDLEEPLRQQLALPVQTLDLAQVLDLSDVPALQSAAEQARYFAALGAALRGAEARA